jgi:regulator of sigma E protease
MFLMSALSMFLIYFISFFVVLTVIVFIHELGHFMVARWCGVKVDTFSIGFGKEIIGWDDRHGTRWKLCWVLLGGYVKFAGDANAASLPSTSSEHVPGSLYSKPVWQRMAVVAAGPIANFLLAIVVFSGIYLAIGVPSVPPVVAKVEAGSAAERAGILPGDIVSSVDGRTVKTFTDLSEVIITRGGVPVNLTVQRAGTPLTIRLTPDYKEVADGYGRTLKIGRIGISSTAPEGGVVNYQRVGPVDAVVRGAYKTWDITVTTLRFIGKLFSGTEDSKMVGGIGSIAEGAGNAAMSGPAEFIFFIGLLSISIGLINLFPIPMLDGGHLVYYTIESIIGKPLSQRAQEIGFRIGLSLVFLMIAFGNLNDISRYFARILGS